MHSRIARRVFAVPGSSGRRSQGRTGGVADGPSNPLTLCSAVNHIWRYHFGRGLVETPNDFGRMGALPSHPELLDWLATEFRDGSQSLKGCIACW